ncbi:alginate lyase family protein [Streptomyces sp. NPDC053048]|uniref:alginate lyase family protein n=1 Tax=Streptomyces sp. NPDC053048 TaxID=3365694 RepID=UPI0037D4839C
MPGPCPRGVLPRISLAAALTAALIPLLAPAPERAPERPVTEPVAEALRGPVRKRAPGQAFRHPGVLLTRAQLDRVRARVARGAEPWKSAFETMRSSRYGSLDYTPAPVAVVRCPPGSRPGHGCVEERRDAIAAYTHALLWYVTRDRAHARKAVEIMDAWSAVVEEHTEGNAPLQAAWAGSSWARAAEIMRYTYDDWPRGRVRRTAAMLRTAYLPLTEAGAPDHNGNWDLAMADATMGIAVFLDDEDAFATAVRRFRDRVPAYFYLDSDGRLPERPPGSRIRNRADITRYWFGQETFVDGIAQETCRNFTHVGYGIAATAHIAETAWHQGVDLYDEAGERLRAALAFHARYQLGDPVPSWLCDGSVKPAMGPDTEVVLNHLRNRRGIRIPDAEQVAREGRYRGTDNLFVAWEALTHANNPG